MTPLGIEPVIFRLIFPKATGIFSMDLDLLQKKLGES
jgi:hypothetical protein